MTAPILMPLTSRPMTPAELDGIVETMPLILALIQGNPIPPPGTLWDRVAERTAKPHLAARGLASLRGATLNAQRGPAAAHLAAKWLRDLHRSGIYRAGARIA